MSDLVLALVLCVVGSAWVGIAAKLGRSHLSMWLGGMLLFYVPLAVVVIWLNRLMPLEGGLYQWAKAAFDPMARGGRTVRPRLRAGRPRRRYPFQASRSEL